MFLKGEVCQGSWFEHTVQWWNAYTQGGLGGGGGGGAAGAGGGAAAAAEEEDVGSQIFWMPFEELKADPKFW